MILNILKLKSIEREWHLLEVQMLSQVSSEHFPIVVSQESSNDSIFITPLSITSKAMLISTKEINKCHNNQVVFVVKKFF